MFQQKTGDGIGKRNATPRELDTLPNVNPSYLSTARGDQSALKADCDGNTNSTCLLLPIVSETNNITRLTSHFMPKFANDIMAETSRIVHILSNISTTSTNQPSSLQLENYWETCQGN